MQPGSSPANEQQNRARPSSHSAATGDAPTTSSSALSESGAEAATVINTGRSPPSSSRHARTGAVGAATSFERLTSEPDRNAGDGGGGGITKAHQAKTKQVERPLEVRTSGPAGVACARTDQRQVVGEARAPVKMVGETTTKIGAAAAAPPPTAAPTHHEGHPGRLSAVASRAATNEDEGAAAAAADDDDAFGQAHGDKAAGVRRTAPSDFREPHAQPHRANPAGLGFDQHHAVAAAAPQTGALAMQVQGSGATSAKTTVGELGRAPAALSSPFTTTTTTVAQPLTSRDNKQRPSRQPAPGECAATSAGPRQASTSCSNTEHVPVESLAQAQQSATTTTTTTTPPLASNCRDKLANDETTIRANLSNQAATEQQSSTTTTTTGRQQRIKVTLSKPPKSSATTTTTSGNVEPELEVDFRINQQRRATGSFQSGADFDSNQSGANVDICRSTATLISAIGSIESGGGNGGDLNNGSSAAGQWPRQKSNSIRSDTGLLTSAGAGGELRHSSSIVPHSDPFERENQLRRLASQRRNRGDSPLPSPSLPPPLSSSPLPPLPTGAAAHKQQSVAPAAATPAIFQGDGAVVCAIQDNRSKTNAFALPTRPTKVTATTSPSRQASVSRPTSRQASADLEQSAPPEVVVVPQDGLLVAHAAALSRAADHQQQQQNCSKQLAIYINGKIRSNSIFCSRSASSNSFSSILKSLRPTSSTSGPDDLDQDDKQAQAELRALELSGAKLAPAKRPSSTTATTTAAAAAASHRAGKTRPFISRLVPRGAARAVGANERGRIPFVPLLLQDIIAHSRLTGRKRRHQQATTSDTEEDGLEEDGGGGEARSKRSCTNHDQTGASGDKAAICGGGGGGGNKLLTAREEPVGALCGQQPQELEEANYKLNPSSMFLRKAMRYYRLWIYGANLTILLGALIFLLSGLYVASDFRFKLIVVRRPPFTTSNDHELLGQNNRTAQTVITSEPSSSSSVSASASYSDQTAISNKQSTTSQQQQQQEHEFGVNLAEPSLLLAYLVVALQLGLLQALGCLGATRMKERLIQTFWYLILGLIFFDVAYLLYWVQRYNVMLETLQNEMVFRLHNHYANQSTMIISLQLAKQQQQQQLDHREFDQMFTQIFDRIQTESHCCGVQSSLDYRRSKWRSQRIEELSQELVRVNGSSVLQDQELMKLLHQVPLVPPSCCKLTTNEELERQQQRQQQQPNQPTIDGLEGDETGEEAATAAAAATGIRRKPVIHLDDSQLPQQVRVPAWSPSMVVEDLVIGPGASPSGSWRGGSNGDKRREGRRGGNSRRPARNEQLRETAPDENGHDGGGDPTLAEVIDSRWLAGRQRHFGSPTLDQDDDVGDGGEDGGELDQDQDRDQNVDANEDDAGGSLLVQERSDAESAAVASDSKLSNGQEGASSIVNRLRAKELHYGHGRDPRRPRRRRRARRHTGAGSAEPTTTSSRRALVSSPSDRDRANGVAQVWPEATSSSSAPGERLQMRRRLSRLVELIEATRSENFTALLWPKLESPSRNDGVQVGKRSSGYESGRNGGGLDAATSSASDRQLEIAEQLDQMRELLFSASKPTNGDTNDEAIDDLLNVEPNESNQTFRWPNELELTYDQFKLIESFLVSQMDAQSPSTTATITTISGDGGRNTPTKVIGRRSIDAPPPGTVEAQLGAMRRRRRERLWQIQQLISATSGGLGCLPRSHYDTERLNTRGCQHQLEAWLESSANILFVMGLCVLTVLKFCSLILLRLEIREMIHKIRVLKGMATEYNALQDLEPYLPRPSVCAQAAELTQAGVTPTLMATAAGSTAAAAAAGQAANEASSPTIGGATIAPPLPAVPRRLGGSFSEAVAAATAAAQQQRLVAAEQQHFQQHLRQYGRAGSLVNCANHICGLGGGGGFVGPGAGGSTRTLGAGPGQLTLPSCPLTPGCLSAATPRTARLSSAANLCPCVTSSLSVAAAAAAANHSLALHHGQLASQAQAGSLRSDLFPVSAMPRRHTAISVCPAAAAAAVAAAGGPSASMSRRGTYALVNPTATMAQYLPGSGQTVTTTAAAGGANQSGMQQIGLASLATNMLQARSLNHLNQHRHSTSLAAGVTSGMGGAIPTPSSSLFEAVASFSPRRPSRLLSSTISHQPASGSESGGAKQSAGAPATGSSGAAAKKDSKSGNAAKQAHSKAASQQQQQKSLLNPGDNPPLKRQSSGGAQSAVNFSLDIAPSLLTESRRSIH